MRVVGIAVAMCAVLWFTIGAGTARAEEYRFAPQTGVLLGTNTAFTIMPFTRMWTQQAGELAIDHLQERYENAIVDIPKMLRAMRDQEDPVVAYTTIVWGDELLRIVCYMDESRSSILRRSFLIVLQVDEGSVGTVPIGTVLAESEFRLLLRNGKPVMTADVHYTPGIFPDILPTTFSIVDQVVPSSWFTFEAGSLVVEHTFWSVPPPDGSDPLVHHDRQVIAIEPRP